MDANTKPIRAVIQGGVAILDSGNKLTDGTIVEIRPILGPIVELLPEDREEFAFWEKLSDDAWQKFLQWERENPNDAG